MGLVDYTSRKPYQPPKSISSYDKLVATLSKIQSDANILQNEKIISAIHYKNYF